MNTNVRVKIVDNSKYKDLSSAQYAISYISSKMEMSQASYKILSALKTDHDIFMEITSAYLGLNEKGNKELLSQLIETFSNLSIDYKSKKIKQSERKTFLSFLREGKPYEGFELFAFITDKMWTSQEFEKVRPTVGTRYYILKNEYVKDLNEFINLELEDRAQFCEMVIYDNVSFASMGVNSNFLNKGNIVELLDSMN